MKLVRSPIALLCVLAACAPSSGRPTPHRWSFAGSGNMGMRIEFDRATLEVDGPIARVWMRDTLPNDSQLAHLYQEEFDCVRGKRRTLLESWGDTASAGSGPTRVGSGGANPGWKEGMWVPNGGPGNWWGRTLLYVCRAAGMPELGRDSVLPKGR